MGMALRATHETRMNAVSSRSHTVFTFTLIQTDKQTEESTTGMLNLVDLAGSERIKKSESEGQRLHEVIILLFNYSLEFQFTLFFFIPLYFLTLHRIFFLTLYEIFLFIIIPSLWFLIIQGTEY